MLVFTGAALRAASPATTPTTATNRPALKITPGQVIVPTDRMRRLWGELISIDFATRTGTFRHESSNVVMHFTVMPYAELLHHAAFGDLQDFRIGERAIFRMHENEQGEWVWLTYIQDEMNMMNGHKEYFYVDSINADRGQIVCTQANFGRSFVREKGILLETEPGTRYWKAGQPASFSDIKVGDKVRTKTHGIGRDKVRRCWEVFLDDESLAKFQTEQKAVHARRMTGEGLPGYVDKVAGRELNLTLFQEAGEWVRKIKPGQKARIAPAGADRKPTAAPINARITAVKMAGNLGKVTAVLDADSVGFQPTALARVWVTP